MGMCENERAEYVSADRSKAVTVERDLHGWIESPRDAGDASLGTFLTWSRRYASPDDNQWDHPEDWVADMLAEHVGDKAMLEAIAAGRIDGLRVVEHDASEYDWQDGRLTVVESYVKSAIAPIEPYWSDEIVLDADDMRHIEEGRGWCADAFGELLAAYGESLGMLADTGMVIQPVYMLDHSGTCYSTSDFGDPWDSGQVGWVYTTPERVAELYRDRVPSTEEIAECLEQEVAEYDAWVNAEVYTVEVDDGSGCTEVCGPYYDEDFDMYDPGFVSAIVGFEVVGAGDGMQLAA